MTPFAFVWFEIDWKMKEIWLPAMNAMTGTSMSEWGCQQFLLKDINIITVQYACPVKKAGQT